MDEARSLLKAHMFNKNDILCVKLAALLHDLGHGPFSHFWEHMLKKLKDTKIDHEEMTIKRIDRIIKNNKDKIKNVPLDDDDVEFIQELIWPERRDNALTRSTRSQNPLKNFYYEIVSNKLNENDLDKWDYIARDSHHVGINTCFEMDRLLKTCHVGFDEEGKSHVV